MIKINYKMIMLIFGVMVLITAVSEGVSATQFVLDGVSFDPAIIAAGDEVDIVIQFHGETHSVNTRLGDPSYKFITTLTPDDTLTKNYIMIQDAEGDDVSGTLFNGEMYNKRFRVKVMNNAPAGNYEFKLTGQWYHNDIPEEGSQYLRFRIPVKKEGIILDIASLKTEPSEVRPGDNYVKIISRIENVGEKDSKSVKINLDLPSELGASYTDANRQWMGRLNSGESKEVTFFVDVDDMAEAKEYDIKYFLEYMDLDDNSYTKSRSIPFLVKERPYLKVIESKGEARAGETGELIMKIKNTGTESAEGIDVRLIKQNSQPFTLDVRSDYIGELKPGETGTAMFTIKVNNDAAIKQHNFQVLIRSKGDSDEGDDNIYTYNRRAQFTVTGKAPNKFIGVGIVGIVIVIGIIIYFGTKKRRGKRGKR